MSSRKYQERFLKREPHTRRREEVGLSGVWALRLADRVCILVERDGIWYRAFEEFIDSNFSHCISAPGIKALKERAEWLYRDDAPEAP